MPQNSPTLALPYLQPAQAQKHVTHNEALRILDAVTQLSVLNYTLTDPPALPAEGDRYIIPLGPSGAWAGQGRSVTVWSDGQWHFFAPEAGWRADVAPTGQSLRYDGVLWVEILPDLQNIPELGVNTTADATNRLSVSSAASLLTHAGVSGGHQVKVNKSGALQTASLLFQTGFSGRAEMGTTGSDNFAIKVSADGTSFRNAMTVDRSTGYVGIGDDAGDQLLSAAINATEPTIQIRNMGGAGGATFRMVDDLSGGDWKFKIKGDGSFKLRNQATGVDVLDIGNDPYVSQFYGPVRLPAYTVSNLPSAASAGAGAQVYVSNASGGGVPAFSDGSAWRRVTDRNVIS